jgi:hypothetical protein
MASRAVLVVGETPSLGRSVADLLEAANIPIHYVLDVDQGGPLISIGARFPLIVAASSGYFCSTARRWLRGEFPRSRLIVVGSRDPALADAKGVRTFPLPLEPEHLLGVVQTMVASA